MKLFLISQTQNEDWDAYREAVVAAPDEETARHMDPGSAYGHPISDWSQCYEWCDGPEHVIVRYLGEAAPDILQGAICSDFRG